MRSSKWLVLLTAVVLLNAHALCQTDPLQMQGMVPWASYQHGDIDSINMQNGFPTYHIPLYSLPQKGRLSLSFSLTGGNIAFGSTKNPDCTQPSVHCFNVVTVPGHSLSFTFDQPLVATFTNYRYPANSNTFYNVYTIKDSIGGSHLLGYDNSNLKLLRATDGSGLLYTPGDPTPWFPSGGSGNNIVYQPDGVQHISNPTTGAFTIQDPDGNSIVEQGTQITDSLGRVLPLGPPNPGSSTTGCPTVSANYQPTTSSSTWSVPGPNGSQQSFLFCYATVTIRTNFWPGYPLGCNTQNCKELTVTGSFLQSVVLPNGTFWTFTYDAANPNDTTSIGYGQVTQIRLPTGGTISYQYVNYYQAAFAVTPSLGRSVSQRTFDPGNGGTVGIWNYSRPYSTSMPLSTTVTDPLLNDTVYTFSTLSSGSEVHETKRQIYQGSQGSGTLLRTITTGYQYATGNPQSGAFSGGQPGTNLAVFPTSVATTLDGGKVTTTSYQYNDSGFVDVQPACTSSMSCTYSPTVQVAYGRATSTSTTDYGGTTLNTVNTQYQYLQNSSYFTANFMDLVSSTTTLDGSGAQAAKTTYGYDENNGSPQGTLGHQTSVSRWLNTTGANVTSKKVYNSQGMVTQSIDPLSNTTKYTYDSTGIFPSQVQRPDTITNGVTTHHIVNYTYDPVVGKPLTYKDENGNQTSYAYDNMGRTTAINYPEGGKTTYCYSDTGGATCTQGSPPYQVVTTQKITSSQTETTTAVVDGLGRLSQTQLNSDPQGTDFTDITYDAIGRKLTQSNPHRATTASTDGIATYQYDSLGRVTQVAPPDGTVPTSGSTCLANNVCTQYSGNTTTVTDQAGNQRRSITDAIGRLIEIDEPGTAFAGTAATGTLIISGTLQSQSGIGAHPGTPGSGTVSISGFAQCSFDNSVCDMGTVSITVNGFTDTTFYSNGSPCCPTFIDSQLVAQSQADHNPYVTVTTNGTGVTLTATTSGANTNYSLSASTSYDTTDSCYDPNGNLLSPCFTQPSFTPTPSGPTLTGGTDAYGGSTVYDSGTVNVTIGSFTASAPYGQSSNSTAAQVAAALVSNGPTGLNRSGSPVTASASGANIYLTYNSVGSAGNVAVNATSSSSNSSMFPNGSFSGSANLSGGQDPYLSGMAHPYVTLYTYNALGNLTCVVQKGSDTSAFTTCAAAPATWRPRSYTYDSLSRLTQTVNPESGTITYQYDNNGNVVSKTDGRGITINYSPTASPIDALNRVTMKTYSDSTPTVKYGYDGVAPAGCTPPALTITNGIGNRTSICDGAGAAAWSYAITSVGWKTTQVRTTNGVTKTSAYQNNFDGSLAALTFPSGRIIAYAYNNAAQPVSAIDSANSINYATGAQYSPGGSLSSLLNGANFTSTLYYNKRLQPCRNSVRSSGAGPTSCADTSNIGNILDFSYNFALGSADNANIIGITNNRDNTRTQSFTYDTLNRVASAKTSSTTGSNCWGETFNYDTWANLLSIAGLPDHAACTQENLSVAVTMKNQVVGDGYDGAGNMTSGGGNYNYDAENRVSSTAGVTYLYDGDGRRVQKSNGKLYWYGMKGEVLDETDLTGNTTNSTFNEYIFFGGKRIARRDGSNNIFYYFSDHLGTARVIVQAGQTTACYDADFYPFGAERVVVNNCSQNYKFGGNERDQESGLDNFGKRYYGSNLGRWVSPDMPFADQHKENPQSLNLYSYVFNRPTVAIDSDGRSTILIVIDSSVDSRTSQTFLINNKGEVIRSYFTKSRGQTHDRSKTGGDTPYGVYDYTATEGGTADSRRLGKAYGTGKVRMDEEYGEAVDYGRSLIRLHGGGSGLGEEHAFDPHQKLLSTHGCTRMENEDVNDLITAIKDLKKQGDPVDHVFAGDEDYLRSLGKVKDDEGEVAYPDLFDAMRAVSPQQPISYDTPPPDCAYGNKFSCFVP